jgi:hypothetical protein
MSDHSPAKAVSEPVRQVPSKGALRHVRAAALTAALVPLAQVAVTPVTVFANESCDPSAGIPCTTVPAGGSTLAMAGIAAAFIGYLRRKNK